MGLSPRIVTEDVIFLWDGVPSRLPKGQVLDVPPDSPLERAIGKHRLIPHGTPPPQPAAEAPAVETAEAVPQQEKTPPKPPAPVRKPAAAGRNGGTDGS